LQVGRRRRLLLLLLAWEHYHQRALSSYIPKLPG
jgi:hypothetical protein